MYFFVCGWLSKRSVPKITGALWPCSLVLWQHSYWLEPLPETNQKFWRLNYLISPSKSRLSLNLIHDPGSERRAIRKV